MIMQDVVLKSTEYLKLRSVIRNDAVPRDLQLIGKRNVGKLIVAMWTYPGSKFAVAVYSENYWRENPLHVFDDLAAAEEFYNNDAIVLLEA